tara:strand:- start:3437 stop:3997 length:561 start_codon:yes stop_codon:yes gene_type:complete
MQITNIPIEAKVLDLSYCDIDDSNNLIEIPIAEDITNNLIESVIAEQILTSTIDSKYITIYRNGKSLKIITVIQIGFNIIFVFVYYIYYLFPVLLAYSGYRGIKIYNFRLMTIYLCYLVLDFVFHIWYFTNNYKNNTFLNNLLNGTIIVVQFYIFHNANKFTKSIKHITLDEQELLISMSRNTNVR